jgi:SAM-dependent methyltransferase
VLALPFRDRCFDGAYSYGVVHHTLDPESAVREIVRTLKTGGSLLLYVYEDFEFRSPPWRIALAAVNGIRGPISRLRPHNIRRFCALIAPAVYLSCTLPSKHFRWAARLPYPARQNPTLRSLIPDLYDRFAAPIEARYSEGGARALLERAGCRVKAVVNRRGWMLWGEKLESE